MGNLLRVALIMLTMPVYAQILTQDQCQDVDIRESNPRIKNSPKLREHFSIPRNQDSIGWCYAFTAADLMSAETSQPISAFHTSVLFNHSLYKNPFERYKAEKSRLANEFRYLYEGGDVEVALKLLSKNQHICSEQELPYDVEKPFDIEAIIKKIEEIKDQVLSGQNDQSVICAEVSQITELNLTALSALKVAQSILDDDLNVSMVVLANEKCQNKISVPTVKVKTLKSKNDLSKATSFFQSIGDALKKGRPVGISFMLSPQFLVKGGEHGSIITGRRWNNGQCEFKVRNSWGKSCAAYHKDIQCIKNEGSFWASAKKLQSSITEISYIEDIK